MYFKSASKGKNHWWRFIVVALAVSLGHTIGGVPLLLSMWRAVNDNPKIDASSIEEFGSNPDFSLYGINANMGFTMLLLSFLGALVAFYFVFKPIHGREFNTLVSPFSKIRWNRIFFSFGLWLVLGLLVEVVLYFMHPENYTFHFRINTFIPLVIISLILLPVQTSAEELFFRGYVMQGIGSFKLFQIIAVFLSFCIMGGIYKMLSSQDFFGFLTVSVDANDMQVLIGSLKQILVYLVMAFLFYFLSSFLIKLLSNMAQSPSHILSKNKKWVALILSSILFGLLHSMNPEINKFGFWTMQAYYVSAGLFFGLLTIMDDGLELALGMHAGQNFVASVFVGYAGGAIQTDSILRSQEINPGLMTAIFIVLAIITTLFFKYKYNWSSFSKIFEDIQTKEEII